MNDQPQEKKKKNERSTPGKEKKNERSTQEKKKKKKKNKQPTPTQKKKKKLKGGQKLLLWVPYVCLITILSLSYELWKQSYCLPNKLFAISPIIFEL